MKKKRYRKISGLKSRSVDFFYYQLKAFMVAVSIKIIFLGTTFLFFVTEDQGK